MHIFHDKDKEEINSHVGQKNYILYLLCLPIDSYLMRNEWAM